MLKNEFGAFNSGFELDAPEKIYSTYYRSDDAEIIHLLNARGANPQYGEILKATCPEEPFPVVDQDITITVTAPANVKEVYAVSPDFEGRKALKFTKENNQLKIVLDKGLLKAYTLVWIKK